MLKDIIYKKLEAPEIPGAKKLIRDYVQWLGHDLSFQDIAKELDSFPEIYAEPDGVFLVAKDGENLVGCVGFKKQEKGICEMKRLFVADSHKGQGIGGELVKRIIREARAKGYGRMRLDTLDTMKGALHLYYKNGFREIAPYYHNPFPGVVYLEKAL